MEIFIKAIIIVYTITGALFYGFAVNDRGLGICIEFILSIILGPLAFIFFILGNMVSFFYKIGDIIEEKFGK